MLNITTCEKIRNSDIWKTWSADWILRMQAENGYEIVPNDVLSNAILISLSLKEPPANPGVLMEMYKQKYPQPLTLKKMLEPLPKSFYMQRVK